MHTVEPPPRPLRIYFQKVLDITLLVWYGSSRIESSAVSKESIKVGMGSSEVLKSEWGGTCWVLSLFLLPSTAEQL